MFHIGQKVVCVNDHYTPGSWDRGRPNLARAGVVYTVRTVCMWPYANAPMLAITLHEVINPVLLWDTGHTLEYAFAAHRFRPVVEKKTDAGMAILKEILERETINDRAPART